MLIGSDFYQCNALELAQKLLGKKLRYEKIELRITEVEAYMGPDDSACHTAKGKTPRNEPMWGPSGRLYIYLCYGMHQMVNIVAGNHDGQAVLIRSCEPIKGLVEIEKRRGNKKGPVLLTGPGKIGQVLAVDQSFNHHPLYRKGGISLHNAPEVKEILRAKRVGIDYAKPKDRDALYRLAVADSAWVSQRKGFK